MIALRGIVHQNETTKQWQWSGLWTFGKLPDHVGRDLESTKVKIPNVRPFHYSWDKPVCASTVEVPSLITITQQDNEEEEKEEKETKPSESTEAKTTDAPAAPPSSDERNPVPVPTPVSTPVSVSVSVSADKGTIPKDTSKPYEDEKYCVGDNAKAATDNEDATTNKAPTPEPVRLDENEKKKEGGEPAKQTDDASKSASDAIDKSKAALDNKADEPTTSKQADDATTSKKVDASTASKRGDGPATTKKDDEPITTKKADIVQLGVEAAMTKPDSEPTTLNKEEPAKKQPQPQPQHTLGITFATMLPDEPSYTEAATQNDACPKDGAWTGYFENIIRGRKAHNRVAEHFSLFLNSTPPNDARIVYLEDDDEANDSNEQKDEECQKQAAAALLPTGRIHVRGMGTNQFGVFELLGSFDPFTKVLELQRMYVSTTPAASKPSPLRKVVSSPAKLKTTTSRPYSTRKRQLSWQRRSTLSDDEDEIVGIRRHLGSSHKKRPRSSSTASGTPAADDNTKASAAMPPPSKIAIQAARPTPMLVPGIVESSTNKKRPSPTNASLSTPGPKKRGGSKAAAAAAAAISPLNPNAMKLPSVGAAEEARWRAAHFFYYQRNDSNDTGSASGGTTGATANSGSAAATSFVVYEGEMLLGKGQREGRGVCLYNNGTLYEGDWKRNREHGKGTLMTADRRCVIYKGEWERGRMHGQGTYFFRPGQSSPYVGSTPTASGAKGGDVTPRYEGEFKENARHGVGKYYLPDGSTYDGEWRENLMSGRGTFVWPDGSDYIGQWKDGRRHGQGLLRSSDLFTYEGMFVKNAMEGRGIAIYPSGQKYEGLFANGRREGRGTIMFVNGAIYEGRFRDDAIEGQGTMKMSVTAKVPISNENKDNDKEENGESISAIKEDWMIPISFQSDMGHIHQKAGFTASGE